MTTFDKKLRLFETIGFFLAWVIVFLLGSDFPPPAGFIWMVLLVAVLDVIQFFYLGYLLPRIIKQPTFWLNFLFFLIGGIVVAIATAFYMNTVDWMQLVIWYGMLAIVSVVYGSSMWLFSWFVKKRYEVTTRF